MPEEVRIITGDFIYSRESCSGLIFFAASVTYHLHSKEPLFKRAISMSGTSLLSKAITYEEHEKKYNDAMAALGLSTLSSAERIKAILEMPASELISKLPPSISPTPAVDSDIVIPGMTYAEIGNSESTLLPGKSWCSDLLIGDAEVDVRVIRFLQRALLIE